MNYKILLAYDGTRFSGWQRQNGGDNTVQYVVEKAVSGVLGENIEVIGSGRTDAGVHAKGQTANFKTDKKINGDEFIPAVNGLLPNSVAIKEIEIVDERFHSRLNARAKTYEYTIWKAPYNDPFGRNYSFRCTDIDTEKMRRAAELFIGTHDFKAFCANRRFKKSTVREIYSVDIYEDYETVKMRFTGSGFLYNMVRIMAGTLIETGEGKREIGSIEKAFASLNRDDVGFTAPPQGLCLLEVFY